MLSSESEDPWCACSDHFRKIHSPPTIGQWRYGILRNEPETAQVLCFQQWSYLRDSTKRTRDGASALFSATHHLRETDHHSNQSPPARPPRRGPARFYETNPAPPELRTNPTHSPEHVHRHDTLDIPQPK